jgi:hypothetical protein
VNVLGCRSFRLEQNKETRQLQLTLAIGATFPLSGQLSGDSYILEGSSLSAEMKYFHYQWAFLQIGI